MRLVNGALVGFILVAFGFGFRKTFHPASGAIFAVAAPVGAAGGDPFLRSDFVSSSKRLHTHAASLVEGRDGRVRALWYAGSREGAPDVEIRSAVFDPAAGRWSTEQIVATREATEASVHRSIRRLGNPVAGLAADGRLWLFYVTGSVGGWSGSSITAMTSTDDGRSWSAPRRLVTSPFLNLGTLVKGAPFLYGDGTMGLPVYHELLANFGELLRFDREGRLADKQRLSAGGDHGLQPVVLPLDTLRALALMRDAGADAPHRVLRVSTTDAGRHWTVPTKSPLSNPGAALSAVAMDDGRIVAVLNDQELRRDTLSLAVSADRGSSWRTVQVLEDQRGVVLDETGYARTVEKLSRDSDERAAIAPGDYVESAALQQCRAHRCDFEFSYPSLIKTRQGDFHLAYTWNRSFIKHVWFSRRWLDERSKDLK